MANYNLDCTGPQDDFIFSEKKFPAIIGGLGSGKTQAGVNRAIILLAQEAGIKIGYYMPTYDLLRRRVVPAFEEVLNMMGLRYTLNKSDWSIQVLGLGEVIFRSYDNPSRIIAYEVSHSIVDELDTLQRDKAAIVWRKITERNRGDTNHPCGNTIGNVSTPDQGITGFTYQRWGKNIDEDRYERIKAPTYSNVFLPDLHGYIEDIRSNYDPVLADVYIEGEFVSLSQNKVYSFYDPARHHTNRKLRKTDRALSVSIDFNVGGCCSILWVIEKQKPMAVGEFVSHDTQDFCNKLAKFERKTRTITVFPDASGKNRSTNASSTDIGIIEGNGFRVDAPEGNPAIRDRINCKNAAMAHDRFLINTDECPEYDDALQVQGYDDKGEPEKSNEHPSVDDWNDSGGYFMNRRFPIIKPIISTGIGMAR